MKMLAAFQCVSTTILDTPDISLSGFKVLSVEIIITFFVSTTKKKGWCGHYERNELNYRAIVLACEGKLIGEKVRVGASKFV